MTPDTAAQTVDSLRDQGYLVIVFSPDEIEGADLGVVEEILTERAWEAIDTSRTLNRQVEL